MKIQQGGNLPRVKLSNQVAIRKMIYHYGPITRAEVSRQLNLTLPTITTNVNAMLSSGLLTEVSPAQSNDKSMGRPASLVDIAADAAYFIGVEMRGTCRHMCLIDLRGKILMRESSESLYSDYDTAIHSACKLIRKAMDSGLVPVEKIARICLSCPGIVDKEKGILEIHPGYHWINKPLRADVADLTGFTGPIDIENNTRARASGALIFQPEQTLSANLFAYLLISAGIACPFIMNNGVISSFALGAGEVGHMVLDPHGPRCRCGNRGCLEAVSSDLAIIGACEEALSLGNAPVLASICQGKSPTMEDILEAQLRGDAAVEEIIQRALYYIGLAIANIYNFIRPDVLFIEGKLFTNLKNRDSMVSTVKENIYYIINDTNFQFVDSNLAIGAIGAASVAVNSYLEDTNM